MERHRTDIVNKSKKHIMAANHPFGEHLKAVKAAAKAAAKKLDDQEKKIEVDGEDLAGLTENEILKKYVKSELSQHHSTSESAKKEEQNKLDALFKLFTRVELAQQTRFSSAMTYAKAIQEKDDTDDDDDGDEDDDDTNVDMNEID